MILSVLMLTTAGQTFPTATTAGSLAGSLCAKACAQRMKRRMELKTKSRMKVGISVGHLAHQIAHIFVVYQFYLLDLFIAPSVVATPLWGVGYTRGYANAQRPTGPWLQPN